MSNTLSFNKKAVRMIAHRGVSGLECENTVAAFVAAGNRSYFGIETDVHLTADGHFVIIHDSATGRLSSTDLCVEQATLAQCRQVVFDRCPYVNGAPRRDLVMPELADYLDVCRRYEKAPVIEIKGRMDEAALARLAAQTEAAGLLANAVFIAFDYENLACLRRLLPRQPLQFLTGEWQNALLDRLAADRIGLDIYYESLTQPTVDALHRQGLAVNCWTCDRPADAERLAAWGVDYITSNILE